MTTKKKKSVCDGRPSFRHFYHFTCPLFPCFDVSDCHGPFSTMCIALCSDNFWLKANQSVALHVTLCVCLVTRRDLAETILAVIISSRTRCQKRSKSEKIPCNFVGSCLVSIVSRHVRFPQKEHTNNHTNRAFAFTGTGLPARSNRPAFVFRYANLECKRLSLGLVDESSWPRLVDGF